MRNRATVLVSCSACALMLPCSPALAQTVNPSSGASTEQQTPSASTPQDNTSGVADIIVTAQKRAQSLNDVGQTINVVSADQLAERNAVTVADLTKIVPGFTVAANGDGTPIYTLRGVSFNSLNFGTSPTVSVYVDEAPLPFSIMTEGALLDLERVEVLKGPQGTLFGQNATGGALNYIAAKPTSELHAGARATYSRFDTFQGEAYVSGPLTDTLRARVAVNGTRSGPWQRSVTRDDELGRQRKLAGRLLLDWNPAERVRFSLNVNGWLDNSDTQAPQFVVARPGNPNEADPRLFAAPITTTGARDADWDAGKQFRRNNDFRQAALRGDVELGDHASLTSLTNYAKVNIKTLSEFDGTNLPIDNMAAQGFSRAFSQELRVSGDVANKRIHYLVGGFFQSDRSLENDTLFLDLNSTTRNVAGIGSFDRFVQHGIQSNRTWAAFANIDLDLTRRLTLSAGGRETWINHRSREGCTRDIGDGRAAAVLNGLSVFLRGAVLKLPPGPTIAAGGCVTLGPTFAQYEQNESFRESSFSWRLNANYKLNEDVLFYLTASRGFKGGNYPVAAASSYLTLEPVRQEKLTAYEAGTKVRLFERRLAVNAAFYYYDYRDKQLLTNTIDPIFNLLYRIGNIPKSKVTGFDVDVTLVPVTGLTLRSAATYARSRVGTFSGFDVFGNAVPLTGNPFNLAPKWTSVSDAEFRHPLNDTLDVTLGASLTYNSRTYADLADSPTLAIRSFTLVDLRAGFGSNSRKWDVMGFVRNVGDVYTWNYAQSGGDAVLRYANQPRTYGLTLSYRY